MQRPFTCLISAQELAESATPSWRIFDCRFRLADPGFGKRAYAEGHLPGAMFLDLEEDLSGPVSGLNGRHPLPDPQLLAAKLGSLGVGPDTQVVAYDDTGGMFAARLWWLLRWLGHSRVAVLDGGLQAWAAGGKPVDTALPEPLACHFEASLQRDMKVNADYVLSHLDDPEVLVIDARAPDRFRGENETLDPVGGHIPGAINRFFQDNLGADGCFKQAAVLQEEFGKLIKGGDAHKVVAQCGSGVTACHNLLAMEAAGLDGARLYPGSWSEWCADPARPIATGP
ncbi:sulfurtransferase [Zoogloea sp.]|uniref:sulfurtransferase n=1 Tax=Zoogloea sp. TaxID=49181 RepID=UPI002629D5FC|nr:sulfurtransferase [uncultured Zoogloea sp.]MCK6387820.1 sulfurtransferase [Zoogloea sp.]